MQFPIILNLKRLSLHFTCFFKYKFAFRSHIQNIQQLGSSPMAEEVVGYLHILVQSIKVNNTKDPIHAHITMGEVAKVDTTPKPSGEPVNEVFLIEVSNKPSRFVFHCYEGEKRLSECRYDIKPFIDRDGICHTIDSDLFDDENKKAGIAKLKITYYSGKNGKLKIRIFHLELHPELIKQFKEAKVKVLCGLHAQSTIMQALDKPFDETVEVLVLIPTRSLIFEVVNDKGIIASYAINNMQESGILTEEVKAYQVSLFNNGKAVGLIKYQINWIK